MNPEPMSDFIREHTHNEYGAFLAYDLREWLLAAGWVPPEEAEALRRERDRCIDQRTVALARAADRRVRVRFLESSWVPPERVEEIECRRCKGTGTVPKRWDVTGFTDAGPCPDCAKSAGGSGTLQIVTKEVKP